MNLTLHMAPTTSLVLPLLATGQPWHDVCCSQHSKTCVEACICHALIERVAQVHDIVIADPVNLEDVGTRLEHLVQQEVTRILVLPWNLHAVTALIVQQAMTAVQRTGAGTVSAASLLRLPISVSGVSPAGPLGGLLPSHDRLDRFVEQWPGWLHTSTVVRNEQAAIFILHTASSHPLRQRDASVAMNNDRLKQMLFQTVSQKEDEQQAPGNDTALHRDSVIYARYLADIVGAALEMLTSLPPVTPNQQE